MTIADRHDLDEARVNRDSPVFGDIAAKFSQAIEDEVARRCRLGLPVVVGDGHGGVKDLNHVSP